MRTQNLSKRTRELLPQLIEKAGINVPIYRIEETKTLVKFYLYGRTEPLIIRKPKARPEQRRREPKRAKD